MTEPNTAAPAPTPAPSQDPSNSDAAVAQGLVKLLSPLLSRYAPWLLAGGGLLGGFESSASANANYLELKTTNAELSRKIDRLADEQGEIRKELAGRRTADAAAVARAQAERHEDRIRVLEERYHELELENAKGKAPK